MLQPSEECQNLTAFIMCEIEEQQVESPDQFSDLLNGLLYNRLAALKDFRKRKQQLIDEEAKREVLEKCASDIMFDYERLNQDEKQAFDGKYGERVSEMMIQLSMLPPKGLEAELASEYNYKVNYRVFDLEALHELRLNLIDYLDEK